MLDLLWAIPICKVEGVLYGLYGGYWDMGGMCMCTGALLVSTQLQLEV